MLSYNKEGTAKAAPFLFWSKFSPKRDKSLILCGLWGKSLHFRTLLVPFSHIPFKIRGEPLFQRLSAFLYLDEMKAKFSQIKSNFSPI